MGNLGAALRERFRALTFELGGPGTKERLEKLTPPRNEYGVDPYGYDVDYAIAALAPFLWLYRKYFRVEVHGSEPVPADGRVIIVCNHSGQLPFDAAMVGLSLLVELDPPRARRPLVEKWVPTLPFVSSFYARMGQVVGTPENCRRLLAAGEAILVFPEGGRGLCKLWEQRYQLQGFGLGFMRLALETDSPIVPVGVVGAEEQAPAFVDLKWLPRLPAMPPPPLTPPLVPLPLPTRYHLHFGAPLRFTGSPDEEDTALGAKVEQVKAAIRALLEEGLRQRKHVFW